MKNIKEFLEEYEVICKKYRLIVSACGCCDSPFLSDFWADTDKDIEEHIEHLRKR